MVIPEAIHVPELYARLGCILVVFDLAEPGLHASSPAALTAVGPCSMQQSNLASLPSCDTSFSGYDSPYLTP